MKKLILFLMFIPAMLKGQEPGSSTNRLSAEGTGYVLFYDQGDQSIEQIETYVQDGLVFITKFFNKPFKKEVKVRLFSSRQQLNSQWQKDWGMPGFQSECWMVGSGIASQLDVLSPSAWKRDACEHDPEDQTEIKRLIFHELTHVLHSNYNRSRMFDDIDNIDWFVEGLATYTSGQLDEERVRPMVKFVAETGGPKELSKFWTGGHRYGLAGSLVAFIDKTYGRNVLSSLMEFNYLSDILDVLKLSEKELIEAWRKDILK